MDHLARRAQLYQQVRAYFSGQGVLEVDVPVIGRSAALDPNLESLAVDNGGQPFYLQTSPEYFMKRLLAAGSGSIYALTRAFRRAEQGRLHNPEFALLEWYRLGYDLQQLIEDVLALLKTLLPEAQVALHGYAELFERHMGCHPLTASLAELNQLVAQHTSYRGELSRSQAFDLLFSQVIEPRLPAGIQVVTHYPPEQAALAQLARDATGREVALRFEVYLDGVELANGYQELTDPLEQRQRFAADQGQRAAAGLAVPAMDEKFLAALAQGLPACSGVALGLDRLLMRLVGAQSLAEVMPFGWDAL